MAVHITPVSQDEKQRSFESMVIRKSRLLSSHLSRQKITVIIKD